MANDLTTTAPPSAASETRSSRQISKLAASIPAWLAVRDLDSWSAIDGCVCAVPASTGSDLRDAAAEHQLAMAPGSRDDRHAILRGLRVATILRNEDEAEARATVTMLVEHLADVPLDILSAGCRAYCNAPGPRFFPRSAGELRTFTDPLVLTRKRRAHALLKLAELADAQDARAAELAADPLTPEAIDAILAEQGLSLATAPTVIRNLGAPREPTEAEAREIAAILSGKTPAQAERERSNAATYATWLAEQAEEDAWIASQIDADLQATAAE